MPSCTDVKEPGWPSESLGVRTQTDHASKHKHPEDRMWLPKGGQIGNGHIRNSSLAQGEHWEKKETKRERERKEKASAGRKMVREVKQNRYKEKWTETERQTGSLSIQTQLLMSPFLRQ